MRVAIIDDERPARSELRYQLLELHPDVEIMEGDSGASALQLAGEHKFDLFFLDIELEDIKGTALVQALKMMQPDMKIIFVTAYSEYAVQAFELSVEDYLMKPYNKRRLEKALEKCFKDEESKQTEKIKKKIAFNYNGKMIFEEIEKIVYIETFNRGCLVHTENDEFYESKALGEYEKQLDGMRFLRIHKSYLVNLDKVREVFPWGNNNFGMKMKGYEKNILPISREKIKVLRKLLEY